MQDNDLFEQLKEEFESDFNESQDPIALLDIAIEGYSSIFDFKRFDLSYNNSEEPLKKYDITYSSMELFLIREFYIHFKVKKNDISDLEEHETYEPNSWISNLKEWAPEEFSGSADPTFHYDLMSNLHKFLEWLRNHSKTKKKYADKYYAWYHGIKIIMSKEHNFPSNFGKKEKIEFGKNHYGTGEGFYKVITKLNLTQPYTFLKSMSTKDRAKWKTVIIDLSNKDADIISYLKKFPN